MRKGMWLAAASVLVPGNGFAQTATPSATPPLTEVPAATSVTVPVAERATVQQTPTTTTDSATVQDELAGEEPDIIVTGSRNLPGSVIGDIPPEVQLGPADIRSYGVNSVAELLTELAPQTGSGRGGGGQPVVLLNGRRISGFSEIRDLPTEAIARVDILPEEVALKYGYRADQRVVNFVLRRRFRAATVEATGRAATEGARLDGQGELDLLTIARDQRINLHLSYREQGALTEAERDVIATASNSSIAGNVLSGGTVIAGVPAGAAGGPVALGTFLGTAQTVTDPTPFRTLLSSSQQFGANATYARSIFGNIGATLNARVDTSNSEGLNGLPTVALAVPAGNPFSPFAGPVTIARAIDAQSPLTQRSSSVTAHVGTTLNGQLGTWNWSLTGAYDRTASKTFTEVGVDATAFQTRLSANDPGANPFGPLTPALVGPAAGNRAFSTSSVGQVDALIFGRLFDLPAGEVSTSIRVGAETQDLDSRAFRTGAFTTGQIARDTVNGQANIDLPIASRRNDFLSAFGQFSLNLNIAADELSDFGTLTTIGYGANWAPIPAIRFIASVTDQDEAPSAAQLGNPVVTTPNVRVFDYVQGTTATVTSITGGNPGLIANNRHASKVALTIKPWSETDFTLTADYTRQKTDDPIAGFPTPTAIIEAAFPDRFARDASGQLIRIDRRPINFAQSERSQLRWGFNWSKPIRSAVQRQLEAFRAGTGPNPFAGLTPPGGRRGTEQGAPGATPPGATPPGATPPTAGATPVPGAGGRGGGEGRGGFRGAGQGGGGGGGFGGAGRGGQGGGRIQFALYHTWRFTDRVLIADGGPELDLLNGDATGGNGGTARHELEAQAGYSNNGIGIRASADFRSATSVVGGTVATPTTLDFGSLATADLRLFADLGQRLDLVRRYPWVRGMRVQVGIDNVFNTRQRVTDAAGETPIGFQPAYLDALGRTVRVSLRKLFF